ncbi:MAG: hypothetical protein VYC51_02065 [Pseudomonadota bacterium]|nr:hypothetical protein [Pseudomonadota bacterium]MEC7826202.1 hypothetical protein [Pseudomonadota bacterium]
MKIVTLTESHCEQPTLSTVQNKQPAGMAGCFNKRWQGSTLPARRI